MASHKAKPHKGLAKRVRVTRKGKVMRGVGGHSHLLSTKNAKRRRRLRRKALLDNPAIGVTIAKALCVYAPARKSPAQPAAKPAAPDVKPAAPDVKPAAPDASQK